MVIQKIEAVCAVGYSKGGGMPAMDEDEMTFLELPKTRLQVVGAELQRVNKNGNLAMRLPINSIESAEFRYRLDPISLVFLIVACGVGGVAHFVSEHNMLTTILYAVAVLLAGFALLAARSARIIIRTVTGVTDVLCSDDNDEGEGFVDSLRGLIDARAGKSPRPAEQMPIRIDGITTE